MKKIEVEEEGYHIVPRASLPIGDRTILQLSI